MLERDDRFVIFPSAANCGEPAAQALLDSSWRNVDTRDVSGDGNADIRLHNDDGRMSIWEMDGLLCPTSTGHPPPG